MMNLRMRGCVCKECNNGARQGSFSVDGAKCERELTGIWFFITNFVTLKDL